MLNQSSPNRIPEPLCVPIPAGEFLMGSDQGQDDERPIHRVYVDSFEMAVDQVRNGDFALFLEAASQPPPPHWNDPNLNAADQPVVAVSWMEAVSYCEWLSAITGRVYRLPTEAE